MGSVLSTAPNQPLPIEQCLIDVDDGRHVFDKNLRSTRFLKVRVPLFVRVWGGWLSRVFCAK